MASIVERPRRDGSSSWQIRWLEDGKQQATTARDERAAKRIKAIIEATGTYTDDYGNPDAPTVKQQAEVFLASYTRGNADTVADYRRIIDQHIAPTFGELAITALTVPMLARWGRGLDMSDKTRANVTAVLSGILESAVPDHLPANPWRRVRLPKTDRPRTTHYLSQPDFALILAEIPERWRLLVTVLATTGMRWGEAVALNVADVDLRGPEPAMRVTKAVKHRDRQGVEPGWPKTNKSVRKVTAPADLTGPLRALVEGRPPDAPLFPNTVGKRIRRSTFHGTVWGPALDRAQDPERHERPLAFRPRIHDLRAAATTWMIEAGVPIDEVADQLGHESINTTWGIYRRVNPEAGRRVAAAMGAVLEWVVTPAIEG